MMGASDLLLDTNIVSYIFKKDSRVDGYLSYLQGKTLFISFITVGELYFWAESRNWGERRVEELENKLRNYAVVPYDHEIARTYARIGAQLKNKGRSIGLHDTWIAATALRHGVPLVTHNKKDFSEIEGLEVISEA